MRYVEPVKYLILGLLMVRPHSLYDLHGRFAEGLSHIYAASYGSIHRALRQLQAAGDIAESESLDASRNKKYYSATTQGRRTWFAWMKQPQITEDSEATMLARVFLLDLVEETGDRREVLQALHRRATKDLSEFSALAEAVKGQQVSASTRPHVARYPLAALDYGLRASEAAVNWIEALMAELTAQQQTEDRTDDER